MATKKHRTVYFNMDDPNDAALDKYVDKLGVKFSGYIKGLIFQDQLSRRTSGPINPYQISQPYMGFDGVPVPPKQETYNPPTPKPVPPVETYEDDDDDIDIDDTDDEDVSSVTDEDVEENGDIEEGQDKDVSKVANRQQEQINNFLNSQRRRRNRE